MLTWVARFGRPADFTLPVPEDYIVTVPEDAAVQRHGRTAFHMVPYRLIYGRPQG